MAQVEKLTLQNQQLQLRNEELETKLREVQEKTSQLNGVIVKMQQQLSEHLVKIQQLESEKTNLKSAVVEKSKDLYALCLEDTNAMKYYTRFSPTAFKAIFKSLLPVKHHNNNALDLSRQFFLMLLKLTHNFGFKDLGFRFHISKCTASRYFFKLVSIVHDRLFSAIVFTPEREILK